MAQHLHDYRVLCAVCGITLKKESLCPSDCSGLFFDFAKNPYLRFREF